MVSVIGSSIAFTLALVIGANNSGAHMAPAYGSGARSRWTALLLFSLFAALGAVLVGPRVLGTVAGELFSGAPPHPWVLLILAPGIALTVIAFATILRVPFPTTPATLSALIGVGLYCGVTRGVEVLSLLLWWIAMPLVVFLFSYGVGRLLIQRYPRVLDLSSLGPRGRRWIGRLLTLEGCYSAFAIGANNTPNAFAPLVITGDLSVASGVLLCGLGFAAGSLLWGHRVLETVGKGITELSYVRALVVGMIAATALLTASLAGIPISGSLSVTGAVLGFSFATRETRSTAEKRNVRRILWVWATGPALAVTASYVLTWMAA